jgi:outer membrane protein assembly factor BamB
MTPAVVARATAILALALVQSSAGPERDYTQWRGRDRDGSASGFVEPAAWPASLVRKWKVEVGAGYGTPLVVGDVVYVFTRMDGREQLVALRAGSGEAIWRSGYDAPYDAAPPAAKHGAGPKATPLYSNGRVFTLGVGGTVAAFDATGGTLIWKIPVTGEPAYFGAASSPLADGDLVLLHPGNYGPLTAFDAATGAVKWTAGDEGFFASPIVTTIDGIRQVVTVTLKQVIGVSPADGRVLWQFPFANNGAITPVVNGDTILMSGLDAGVVAMRPHRNGAAWTVEKTWDTAAVSMYVSNPVLADGTLFGLSHRASGQLFAIDAANGAVRWLGEPRWAGSAALVKSGRLLFILKDDGTLVVARANPSRFETIVSYTVADSATWAQPAISGDRILVKDVTSLTLWTVQP